ncbi:hypothetical protein [Clostridium sp. JNZ J1-5]
MKIKKRYIIITFIILLFASTAILKYYRIPRHKTIPSVKLETFSFEKQWEHIKKTASINGDARLNSFSLELSKDGKIIRSMTSFYVKKKSGRLEEFFLGDSGDTIDITICPLKKDSVNIEEHISMDELTKVSDKFLENLNTIFQTPGEKYEFLSDVKLCEYNKLDIDNKVPMKVYYLDSKNNGLKVLSKEDLPIKNTISIVCIKSIEAYPSEERAKVVYQILP